MIQNKSHSSPNSKKKSFSLRKLCVVLALAYSQHSLSNEVCTLPIETLPEESELSHELKQLSPQSEAINLEQVLPEATSAFKTEQKFTPHTALFEGSITESESVSMLTNLRRYTGWAAEGLEALGPVFDVVALGLWADDLVKTFSNKNSSSLDKAASIVYLIPVVSNATEALAQADHFNEHLKHHINEINQQTRYVYKDTTQQAQQIKRNIMEIMTATEQNLGDYEQQIFARINHNIVYGLKTYQEQSLTWLSLLQKTIHHLDLQFYKSLYYDLYKPPYNLAAQADLAYTPLECDARTFNNHDLMSNPHSQEAIDYQQRLQTCLNDMTRNTMRPLIDVLHKRHPHMNIQKWIDQGHQLAQAKKVLVQHVQKEIKKNRTKLEKSLIQQFKTYLAQVQDNPQLEQYLDNTLNLTQDLAFKHWIADEFSDVPEAQRSIDSAQHILTIKPYQACSDKVLKVTSSFPLVVPAWPVLAYCKSVQSLINKNDGEQVVTFEQHKSPDLVRINKLIENFNDSIAHIDAKAYVKRKMRFGYQADEIKQMLLKYAYAFKSFANFCQGQNQKCNQRLLSGEALTQEDTHQFFGQRALYQHAHSFIVDLKQNYPALFAAFKRQFKHLRANGHRSFSAYDFLKVINQYPLTQEWYVERNYEKLGHLAPVLLYKHLMIRDELNNTGFIYGNNTKLPQHISGFLQQDQLSRFTENLQNSFAQYEEENTLKNSDLFNAYMPQSHSLKVNPESCDIHKHMTAQIKELNTSTLSHLPFWSHMLKKLISQREMYDKILTPLCNKRKP
tara:strand:- start:8769 stop:11129 length:2361 start_codon:yes stop_codon:yes gene_type:complete